MSLFRATRSEVTKQFSTAIWWVLALVLVFYVGSTAGGLGFILVAVADGLLPSDVAGMPLPDDIATLLYSFASSLGYVFALLVGTLMVTSEYRHKTLTPTFLATPRRGSALLAKVLVGILIGVIYGVIALASAVGPAAGILAGFGQPTGLDQTDTWMLFGRILLALVLWTLMGIGLGALVRNQVAAVVGVIAFTMFLEPIVRTAAGFAQGLDRIAAYLPGAASDALVGASIYAMATPAETYTLDWWMGGAVLGGYTLVFLVLGYLFSWRRDVS